MVILAAPAASVVIDPTMLALLSIFGGAALTVVAGFVGAWIQGRREHSRWQRDQRLTAYGEHIAATDRFIGAAHRGDPAELPKIASDMLSAIALVQLLGPDSVYNAANAYQTAAQASIKALEDSADDLDQREDARLAARATLIRRARKVVKIKA